MHFKKIVQISITSVIRQKGESQNGCFKKTKHAKFSEKQIFLTAWYEHIRVRTRTYAYQGVRIVPFSENLACFVFLRHRFWDSPFCFIVDDNTISKVFRYILLQMVGIGKNNEHFEVHSREIMGSTQNIMCIIIVSHARIKGMCIEFRFPNIVIITWPSFCWFCNNNRAPTTIFCDNNDVK